MDRSPFPLPANLAILGIGNEFRGDDAAGLHVARGLLECNGLPPGWLVLETGAAPENFTGWLRRFTPEMVLLVDAAQMGAHPGEMHWLDWRDTTGMSASTHTLPLNLVAQYIEQEFHCPVWLVGIQPEQNEVGALLSPAVAQAVAELVKLLKEQYKHLLTSP